MTGNMGSHLLAVSIFSQGFFKFILTIKNLFIFDIYDKSPLNVTSLILNNFAKGQQTVTLL